MVALLSAAMYIWVHTNNATSWKLVRFQNYSSIQFNATLTGANSNFAVEVLKNSIIMQRHTWDSKMVTIEVQILFLWQRVSFRTL